LLPGEEKTVGASYNSVDLKDAPALTVDGYNVALAAVSLNK
jgi:hypothetical protein